MSKSLALFALTLAAIAATTREASALPVPGSFAESYCKGGWTLNMNANAYICSFCAPSAGKPRCDFFVCDANKTSCDWIVVEKRKPKGPWSHPTPVLTR
jgi:hypothetical protein